MNLKIGPEHIRFRITEREFDSLVEHGALSNGTSFGESTNCYYGIRTHQAAKNRDGQSLALATHANEGTIRFILTVFADAIAQLKTGSVGKDGVTDHVAFESGDMLTIGLEIDVHSKKRID